jgi:hypothetical protein
MSLCLVLLSAAAILFIRKGDSLVNPQFWAEDGSIFFAQQYNEGAMAMLEPYAGYMHFVQRVIAFLSEGLLSYAFIPAAYSYSCLLLTLVVVAEVFSPRLSLRYKPLVALAVVLVPHYTNEVFLNIANVQWILALLLIMNLLKESPNEKFGNVRAQLAWDIAVTIVCGLTGPFVMLLLPLYIWKWARNRNVPNAAIGLSALAASCVQIYFVMKFPEPHQEWMKRIDAYVGVIGCKLFGSLFAGEYGIEIWDPYAATIGFVFFVAFLVWAAPDTKSRRVVLILLAVLLAVTAAAIHKFRAMPGVLGPIYQGQRYFYIPHIMLIWSLIICLDNPRRWVRLLIGVLLGAVLVSSLVSGFRSPAPPDKRWDICSKMIGKYPIEIRINPGGWRIHLDH